MRFMFGLLFVGLLCSCPFSNRASANEAEISYYYDASQSQSIHSIADQSFNPYTKAINQGLKTGTYWVKVNSTQAVVVQIKNTLIRDVKAYSNNEVLQPLPTHNFVSFHLDAGISFLEVMVDKFAFIPIATYTHKGFLKSEQRQNAVIGMFYGFGLMVLLLNLLFYLNFKDKTFLYYLFFLSSVLLTFAHRDGFISMLGIGYSYHLYSEVFTHAMITITSVIFANEYLQIKATHPKFLISFYFATLVSISLDVVYLVTGDYLFNALSDVFIIYIFLGIWFASFLLAKKHQYALLFFVAYSLIILFGVDFYISTAFGWFHLGVDQYIIKLGSYFEMLIITLAVVLRMKSLKTENDEMRLEIEAKIQEINHLVLENGDDNSSFDRFAGYYLSSREAEVVELIATGKTNKEIATELFVSVNTVKYHLKNIYQKLKISGRKEIHKVIS